ncbi:winged helix-turn-helix transcriptional regulator [Glaciihabitans sp. INWT7]|uniref:GntR family transcriptional regulator n=1 Tax=Glaciihabitans sp. INWT7 TaxID=2596912 RepID=UPI0016255F17|nr:winged helix-turn-helix domain-containing protein [Glaciihabitans sp. INWT7]QNE48290.1 winged helix-turn-helix transcriptional regulator [Glaciihabitans sp. INWT7]
MYEQIKSQVRSAIYGGDLHVGEQLPSLRQLAADLRVSLMTVTRAYNDLVAERVVINEHGRGFLVMAVDVDSARAALGGRLDAALTELAAAARGARITRAELDILLDEKWSKK